MEEYAVILRQLRKERGLTQSDVAKGAGISTKTIYRYEHGKVKRYYPSTIEKFAKYYKVEYSDIWKENNHEKE